MSPVGCKEIVNLAGIDLADVDQLDNIHVFPDSARPFVGETSAQIRSAGIRCFYPAWEAGSSPQIPVLS
jgi:hypothetical protein